MMSGLMNSYKNSNIFFNVDDIITTSSVKVLTKLKTQVHFPFSPLPYSGASDLGKIYANFSWEIAFETEGVVEDANVLI